MKNTNSWLNYLHLGWNIAFNLTLFTVGGNYLDKKFNTKPMITLGGAVLGIVLSLYQVLKLTLPNKEETPKSKTKPF